MAYFEPSIDADGIHVPTYLDIMDYLINQYKVIFGDDVYLGEDTKDYQLLSVFAKCMDDYSALVIDSYNARNPNYATGDSLDLLLPLVSMTRRPATASKVMLSMEGTPGTSIPEGSLAIDTNGILWKTDSVVVLDNNGSGNVMATCDTKGAIPAPVGSINGIYTPVSGWESVTNDEEAIVGRNIETDDEVRIRRRESVNVMNNGVYDALVRALDNLDVNGEVLKYSNIAINDSSETSVDGIPPHSICCVVDGLNGYEKQIAEHIWKAKSPGIGTYGGNDESLSVSETYIDAYGHSNVVNFARPKKSAVSVVISLNELDGYDAERVEAIIRSAINGGINDLGIGKSWNVTMAYRDIYNAFANELCPFVVTSVTGKTDSMASASTVEVPCAFSEMLYVEDADISIVVS